MKQLTAACAALALLSAAPAARATTCQNDGACAKDEHCELAPCATPACPPGEDCSNTNGACPAEGTCRPNGPGSSCSENANCPSGLVCEVVGGSDCAAPGCEPGKECPPAPPCEPQELKACVPAPCTSDAQCGDGLVCITFKLEECTAEEPVSCAPGEECKAPDTSATCTERSRSICAPPYVAPCKVAADCGAGFDCKPQEQCECSGGGATPPTDPAEPGGADDEVPPPADAQCSCSPTGENYCAPQEITCTTDAGCPAGWSCEAAPPATCVDVLPAADGGSSGSGSDQCPPPDTAPSALCVPPAWDSWGWGGARDAGGGSYGEALSAATGANGDVTVAPRDPSPTAALDRGCAIAGATDAAVLPALLLLGLLALRRRPRG